jgi:hypothetical protein
LNDFEERKSQLREEIGRMRVAEGREKGWPRKTKRRKINENNERITKLKRQSTADIFKRQPFFQFGELRLRNGGERN